jgi:chromosome segregation ATPase
MSDNIVAKTGKGVLWLVALAGIYMVGSLYMLVDAHQRLGSMETAQVSAQTAQQQVSERMDAFDNRIRATNETVMEKLGVTQQELQAKTDQLLRQQRASVNRLMKDQKERISAVTGEVEGVKTEVGNVKTDIATARTDLDATRSRLDSTIGDLGLQSGLIARTREELDELRRRGEKNYHEFTLVKGQSPTPLATVSLQLRKSDQKRSKFTLNLIADDRRVEKKDKTIFEPLQFYTGRDRQLYEVVVFSVDKNKVSGYLATPKVVVAAK